MPPSAEAAANGERERAVPNPPGKRWMVRFPITSGFFFTSPAAARQNEISRSCGGGVKIDDDILSEDPLIWSRRFFKNSPRQLLLASES